MKRVVIFGPGASGKSTLALRLGEITGLSVIELDKVFWRPGLVPTPRDFSWTSRSSDALGEHSGDRASVSISGSGCCGIAAKAVRFSWMRSLTTPLTRPSTYYVTLRHSGDSSQT